MSPPPSSSTGSTPVFIAFIGLTFYGLGAGYLELFVNYPLWHISARPIDRPPTTRRWAPASWSFWRFRPWRSH